MIASVHVDDVVAPNDGEFPQPHNYTTAQLHLTC